jgi:hypothetical protein
VTTTTTTTSDNNTGNTITTVTNAGMARVPSSSFNTKNESSDADHTTVKGNQLSYNKGVEKVVEKDNTKKLTEQMSETKTSTSNRTPDHPLRLDFSLIPTKETSGDNDSKVVSVTQTPRLETYKSSAENTPTSFRRLVSLGFMEEEKEAWSPEIPFRDLNDFRLSVDDDPVAVKESMIDIERERLSMNARKESLANERGSSAKASFSVNVEEGGRTTSELLSNVEYNGVQGDPRSEARASFTTRGSLVNMDLSGFTAYPKKKEDHSTVSFRKRISVLGVPSIVTRPEQEVTTNVGMTVAQQVDIMLDQYIEIESNKRMMQQNVNWFCLTFKVKPMENKFHQIKDNVFKSNAVCLGVSWFLLTLSQVLILPVNWEAVVTLILSFLLVLICLVVIMSSEFYWIPLVLKKTSLFLENNRSSRNLVACIYIFIVFLSSTSVLVSLVSLQFIVLMT